MGFFPKYGIVKDMVKAVFPPAVHIKSNLF